MQKLFLYQEVIDDLVQQIILTELDASCDAGFSFENLERLKSSSSYKSTLYFDALKSIH